MKAIWYAEKLANDTGQKAINSTCDHFLFLNTTRLNRQPARRDFKFIVPLFRKEGAGEGDPCLKSLFPGHQRTLSATRPPVTMSQVSEQSKKNDCQTKLLHQRNLALLLQSVSQSSRDDAAGLRSALSLLRQREDR